MKITPTVIFIVSYSSDFNTSPLYQNLKKLYKILVFDVSELPWIRNKPNPRNIINSNKDEIIKIKDFVSFIKLINKNKKSIFIGFFQDDMYDLPIKILLFNKIIIIDNSTPTFLNEQNIYNLKSPFHFFNKVNYFFYIFSRFINFTYKKNVMLVTKKIRPIGFHEVIQIRHPVYDNFTKMTFKRPNKTPFIGIILQNFMFQDYDMIKDNEKIIDHGKLLSELKSLLSKLAISYNIKIFLHPNTDKDETIKLLGNYDIQNNVSFDKLLNCNLVIGCWSTALFYPLLLNIPTALFTSNIFYTNTKTVHSINFYTYIFGVKSFNLSEDYSIQSILTSSKINKNARMNFINEQLGGTIKKSNIFIIKALFDRLFKYYF